MEQRIRGDSFAHSVSRLAAVALPAATFAAAAMLCIAAPLAWGAGDGADLPSWFPTFTGLAAGVPALLISGVALRQVWSKTGYTYLFNLVFLGGGFVCLMPATFMLAAMSGTVGARETYESPLAISGEEPTVALLILVGFFAIAAVLAFCSAGATMYARAFEARLRRYEEEVRPDTVGMMMRRQQIEKRFNRPGSP